MPVLGFFPSGGGVVKKFLKSKIKDFHTHGHLGWVYSRKASTLKETRTQQVQ